MGSSNKRHKLMNIILEFAAGDTKMAFLAYDHF
jgi:hypothetical protein